MMTRQEGILTQEGILLMPRLRTCGWIAGSSRQ
jgi:hypothetical protein